MTERDNMQIITPRATRHTVWTATTFDFYPLVFVWNGSVTVNVYTGLADNDDLFLEDVVNTDVFTIYGKDGSIPTVEEVEKAVQEYLGDPR